MRILRLLFATILFIGGLVTFWLPVPLGLPLLLVSVPLLMKYSSWARRHLLGLGSWHPRLAQLLRYLDSGEQRSKIE